jgi:hypothetical protein
VHRAAAELIAPVLAYAVPYAERYVDLDALIAEVQSDPAEYGWQAEAVPLLLAAAGRFDEARQRLAEYMTSGRTEVAGDEHRRFAYQLNRWLDAGGVLPDPPTGPLGGQPVFESPSTSLPSFSDIRRSTEARRQAFDAVRRRSEGMDRSQRRDLLLEELGRREITLSPLAVELQLDKMDLGPTRAVGRGLKMLAGLASGVRKTARDGIADPPEWLQPPPRASYPVRGYRNWVAVELDPDAGPWLDQVLTEAPNRLNNTTQVTSWLAWDPESRTPDSRLAVHLGSERVGVVDLAATKRFVPVMEAAARRQELPWLRSRLTAVGGASTYLLELPTP